MMMFNNQSTMERHDYKITMQYGLPLGEKYHLLHNFMLISGRDI